MKKWNELSPDAKALAFGGACIVAGWTRFRWVVRNERKKRRQICEWEQMNLDAIKAVKANLSEMAENPDISHDEFISIAREEFRFLAIIRNQPMHD